MVWGLRKDQQCPSAGSCPEATTVSCRVCRELWIPPNLRRPGPCPACGASEYQLERCPTCVHTRFLNGLETEAGELLLRVFDLEEALWLKFRLGLDDVTAEEFWGLRVLRAERNRKEKDDMEAEQRQAQMRQRKMTNAQAFSGKDHQG